MQSIPPERNVIAWVPVALAGLWLLPLGASWRDSADLGHAWAVPLLMVYLWWERWPERPAEVVRDRVGAFWWVAAVAIALAALPLRLLLTPFPVWAAPLTAFTALFAAVALSGAWLVAGRPGVKWVGGPLILVLSALPVPVVLQNSVIMPLREVLAALAAEVSNLLGQPALALGTSIRLGAGWVGIDEACGGIRSLQACIMIGLFFGEWQRFSVLRRLGLVALGALAAVLGNFGRVLFLAMYVGRGGTNLDSVHDAAGWAAMGLSLVLTGWMACHWAGYRWPVLSTAMRQPQRKAGAWAWLTAVTVLLGAGEVATRLWYARGAHAQAELPRWTVRLPEKHWSFKPDPLPEVARDMLRPDFYTAGHWKVGTDRQAAAYYIVWLRGQVARSVPFLHNPTVCLPFSGCELLETLEPITVNWAGGRLEFAVYRFRRVGGDIIVAFTVWDTARGRALVKPSDHKSSWDRIREQWFEVLEARENQPAQMFTVSLSWNDDARGEMYNLLKSMIVEDPR